MQHPSTYEALPDDWAIALSLRGFDNQEILKLRAAAYDLSAARVLPIKANLFRAFYATPLSKVRVAIVGKDPYPDSEDASGISFSAPPHRKPPLALRNIFTNLEGDDDITFARPKTGDLTAWATEGALLLNAALTLSYGSASARFTLWKPFLKAVLSAVSDQPRPIPVVLLGGEANDLSRAVRDRKAIISAGHPTPRNNRVSRFALFRHAKPFSEANVYLEGAGADAFDWSVLPR